MQANKTKQAQIMDVNATAVKDMFMNYNIKTLVHGHTHRPAVRVFDLGQGVILRHVVLPDWDYDQSEGPRGGWLHISANTLKLISTTGHDFPVFERP
jgi:UDP-2,3-diacylglucosamine hydrolase